MRVFAGNDLFNVIEKKNVSDILCSYLSERTIKICTRYMTSGSDLSCSTVMYDRKSFGKILRHRAYLKYI